MNTSIDQIVAAIAGGARRTNPFLVGITGGVASGKSTLAASLAAHLAAPPPPAQVISLDGYLKPNAVLEAAGIMHRKGFPETFDLPALLTDMAAMRAGSPIEAPLYDHAANDVIATKISIAPGGILILEGVIALNEQVVPHLDYKIYLDTDVEVARQRFEVRAQRVAAEDPKHPLNTIPPEHRLTVLNTIWREVNVKNLTDHIAPTKAAADIVIA